MITEAGQRVELTGAGVRSTGLCGLLDSFVAGALGGNDYLELLFHLDECRRCYERVRSFPQEKRRELYALRGDLKEVVFEESPVVPPAGAGDEEVHMLAHENRTCVTETREEIGSPCRSADFDRVGNLLEHEIRAVEEEIEKLKAKLSIVETKRVELQADLEHILAATQIIERFRGGGPKISAPVPFARSKASFANVTQREAILQVLSQNPTQAMNKKMLTQSLIDGGFPFRSAERTERQNTVYQTCRRMVEADELMMTIHERDGYYRLVNGFRGERQNVASAAG